jgi:hypothetical protein
MKRYSIVGHRYGERGETSICEVDTNPQPLAHIAAMKRIFLGLFGKRKLYVNKYENVRVIDHVEDRSWNIN